jgi:hypothetical protein
VRDFAAAFCGGKFLTCQSILGKLETCRHILLPIHARPFGVFGKNE